MIMREEERGKYHPGAIVYAKVNPHVKLVVRRYVSRVYYCQSLAFPERNELALFEREILE